ncbi:hypothetical protein GCM10009647_085660 [Streptomyces sanglieri]
MMETSDISIDSPGASLVAARRPSLDAATSKRLTVGKSGITSRRQADEPRGERAIAVVPRAAAAVRHGHRQMRPSARSLQLDSLVDIDLVQHD